MSRHPLCSFRWDGTQWALVNASSDLETNAKPVRLHQSVTAPIRIATLNVLADCFPWYIQMAIRSAERFEWLCSGISSLNPTIIGLNEVTPRALSQLQQCSFIRENYFITESVDEAERCMNGLCSPHGTIMLSKLPFLEVFALPLARSRRRAVVGQVLLGNRLVHVCALHVRSQQTPRNAQVRAQQIRDIVQALEPLGYPFVLMGDLNLHYQCEDAVVVDNLLIDAWAQTHFSRLPSFNDGQQGYTFDAIENTFIPYYIPGERRQMRLDRILFSRGFPAFAIAPCALWANQLIKPGSYLFPSDHFGLSIDLISDGTDSHRNVISLGEPDATVDEILHRNAENNADQQPYRLGLVRTTTALTLHLAWLGAVALGLK